MGMLNSSSRQHVQFGAGHGHGVAAGTAQAGLDSLYTQVSQNAALQAAGISVSHATAASNALAFTNKRGESFNVTVTGDTKNTLGLGTFYEGSGGLFDYTSITAGAAAWNLDITFPIPINFTGLTNHGIALNWQSDPAGLQLVCHRVSYSTRFFTDMRLGVAGGKGGTGGAGVTGMNPAASSPGCK